MIRWHALYYCTQCTYSARMEKLAVAAAPESAAPAADTALEDDGPLLIEDLLVEDVSIDGMCGVY